MPETIAPNRSSRNRWLAGAIVVLLLAGLAWWQWPAGGQPPAAGGASGPGGPGGFRGMGGGPVPVRVAEVVRGDFAVELKALGTVTAFNAVNVLPRVDGQLVKVLFEEGQRVKAGQLLAQIDPRPYRVALQQAEGNLQERRAELKNAELDLQRYQGLYAEDSIAKQTLDTQRAQVEQLRGGLNSLEAAAASARLNLEFTAVRAPIAGRLGLRQVDVGNLVTSGDATPLVTITQTTPISVSFTLPEAELPAVLQPFRAGEKLVVEAWDRGERQRLAEGELASLDNQIDTTTGTVRLKARFANGDEQLFPSQFVNVRLRVGTRQQATLIPSAALQFGSKGSFVYVVGADNKVQLRPVQAGPSNGETTLIESGLALGERLVLEGTDRLRDGGQVEVIDGQGAPAQPPAAAPEKAADQPTAKPQAAKSGA